MSAAEFQKRIADLTFSAKEHVTALQEEQKQSEAAYEAWDNETFEETDDNIDNHADNEPNVIDNSTKIASIETAIDHLEVAVDELDRALDDE